MAIDELVTYLRLAPEFGGTRFGPFEDLETRLGANSERCHIVLSADLGVLPEHVKLIRNRDNSLILAPAERTATVFLWKPNERRPAQVYTPTAVRTGDAFSLVTPDGPRFIIELDELPAEVKQQRENQRKPATGRRRLTAATMGNELKRQAWTRLLVLGPAQLAQRAWLYVVSGAIYQPRNIILGITLLSGWMFGGVSSCRMSRMKGTFTQRETELTDCREQLGFASALGADDTQYKFANLAGSILNSTKVGTALDDDSTLRNAVKLKVRSLLLNPKPWQWLYKNSKAAKVNNFAKWRERIMATEKLDADTAKLLVWLGASAEEIDSDFIDVEDSESARMCGRGQLGMTYRQALHLGLGAQPDGFILVGKNADAIAENKEEREKLLLATILAAGGMGLPEGQIDSVTDNVRQGVSSCVYLVGDDERMMVGKTTNMLIKQLGPEARQLPPDTISWSPTARVAKYWAADIVTSDYSSSDGGIDFSQAPVSSVIEPYGSAGKWVLEQTAETIARGIALPCIAVLNGDAKAMKPILGDNLPSPVSCLILDWKLRNDQE